jgi:RNA polymerase sigma-70 factor, ECF subfamily
MSNSPCDRLQRIITQSYEPGRSFHGHLALDVDSYTHSLFLLIQKHCGALEKDPDVVDFLKALHTSDLYLTLACAQGSDAAWRRFQTIYQRHIYETALFLCQHQTMADELASTLMGHLFIKDSSGRPRIASYDGRVALTAWLWAVIAHKALDERQLKHHHFERLESLAELPDCASQRQAELALRTTRYGQKILAACKGAIASLSAQERSFLLLHYQEDLRTRQIAELYEMSKTNVNYHLRQARQKLGQAILSILRDQYGLSEAALEDCKEELLENSAYSLLALIPVEY